MTAIEFENISKQYRLGVVSTQTLSHDLNRWWTMNVLRKEDPYLKIGETNDRASKGESDYVWALKDINFKIEQGDVVGIIGKNGAGKSTLLKLLSKVTAPTTGTIKARGRIASLLEVGTGFHPEMTGRENIFMNGAIMGMTKHEIARKLDEIVDFSGYERYLDTPVKRYSSGMTVRLGFAIAAHLDPEILVVDEVLAVGDAEFQKKAIGKMQDVSRGEGRTVLFVSHNMTSMQQLCSKGILMENGMLSYQGDMMSTITRYQSKIDALRKTYCDGEILGNPIDFLQFYLEKNGNSEIGSIVDGDQLKVTIRVNCLEISSDITLGVSVIDKIGRVVYRTLFTDSINNKIGLKLGDNKISTILNTDILNTGDYNVVLDASYHNRSWIINPYTEEYWKLFFRKDQSGKVSTMQSTNSSVNPIHNWVYGA